LLGQRGSNYPFLTQKERDIETGLDYFEARYYSSTQGRFTSVDPFNLPLDTQQAAERNSERARSLFNAYLSQPQQWNRYSYGINNPLLYVDPTGEAIQLSNDKDERERQTQALREAVGSEAAQYLYVNQGTNPDGSTNYYVGIYDSNPSTGDQRSFEQVNEVAGEYGAIIRDTQSVKLEFVGSGTVVDDYGDRTYIGRASSSGAATPAATGYFKGQ
jgi:RHS repeat-associated protein